MDHSPQAESDSSLDWVDVGNADEIKQTGACEVIAGPDVIAVFWDGHRFSALDGLCAHQGGPIAKGVVSKTDKGHSCVTCPWHGWQYELETGIQTVNRQPLQRTFVIRENAGRVEVAVGR